MKKISVLTLLGAIFIAGCGGSGTTTTSVSGAVADGYLQNAVVFLDRNGNYQADPGEPSTTTDADGKYTLNVPPEEVGKYPIVALAIAGQTIDADSPGLPVTGTYVLCIPGQTVSGTVQNFISPISTLLREKMESGLTKEEALVQLRNQLGMPAGVDMMGDYVAGSRPGQQHTSHYENMHRLAQQMAGLMADQAGLVMNDRSVYADRFRTMMGEINDYLPQIAGNAIGGFSMTSDFMNTMRTRMQEAVRTTPAGGGFRNFSTMFRNMTSVNYFWNYSGGQMHPRGGMMRGRMVR